MITSRRDPWHPLPGTKEAHNRYRGTSTTSTGIIANRLRTSTRRNLAEYAAKQAARNGKLPVFHPDKQVSLYRPYQDSDGPNPKLLLPWRGPYVICSQLSPVVVYTIQMKLNEELSHLPLTEWSAGNLDGAEKVCITLNTACAEGIRPRIRSRVSRRRGTTVSRSNSRVQHPKRSTQRIFSREHHVPRRPKAETKQRWGLTMATQLTSPPITIN